MGTLTGREGRRTRGLRSALLAFALSYLGLLLLLLATARRLPERVATHFGLSGSADGWMSRPCYLAFTAGFPLAIGALIGGVSLLTRVLPAHVVSLPHSDYWLAPERKEASLRALQVWLMVLLCFHTLLFAGMHVLTLEANRSEPPRLALGGLLMVMAAFLIALAVWLVLLFRRFSAPGRAARHN